ncbi:unnamed protein product [Gongylonema pulchrum]|uniref:Secreted protein n=1 Tax=Gongylonema pulchrum TaxID=637853 RepID=A0A183D191_9BILA|nr:unnamed protein product [Gongylonema pulchrum]
MFSSRPWITVVSRRTMSRRRCRKSMASNIVTKFTQINPAYKRPSFGKTLYSSTKLHHANRGLRRSAVVEIRSVQQCTNDQFLEYRCEFSCCCCALLNAFS